MNQNTFTETKLLPDQLGIFYLGQVGFIVKFKEKYVLIDGYLSDYVDRNCSSELVKWVRRYPAPIEAEELSFVDYVFCTHSHFDHADPDTLKTINSVNNKAKFIVSNAIKDVIKSYGISEDRILGVKCDEEIVLDDDIKFTAIPSAHEVFHQDKNGDYEEVGFKISFGDILVYHGGDGCPYDGLEERLKGCDILMLPVNGRDYYRTVVLDIIGCFDSKEAAIFSKNIDAKLLIPTHFDLYDVNCINPSEFVDKLNTVNPMQCYHIFKPGEKYIFSK